MVLRNLRRFKNYVNQYQFLMLTFPCRIMKLYHIWNFYKLHIDIFLFSFPFFKYRSIVNFKQNLNLYSEFFFSQASFFPIFFPLVRDWSFFYCAKNRQWIISASYSSLTWTNWSQVNWPGMTAWRWLHIFPSNEVTSWKKMPIEYYFRKICERLLLIELHKHWTVFIDGEGSIFIVVNPNS